VRLIGIDMVQLQVKDWPAAVRWYRDKLSFQVLASEEDHAFCLMGLPNSPCQLALYGVQDVRPGSANRCIPCIRVEGLQEVLQDLRARSVEITTGIYGDETYQMATIKDPEGNDVYLYEWVSR
jgi:Glyoxalase/Bleomycin resistance protein/Dioxygenase superfamily